MKGDKKGRVTEKTNEDTHEKTALGAKPEEVDTVGFERVSERGPAQVSLGEGADLQKKSKFRLLEVIFVRLRFILQVVKSNRRLAILGLGLSFGSIGLAIVDSRVGQRHHTEISNILEDDSKVGQQQHAEVITRLELIEKHLFENEAQLPLGVQTIMLADVEKFLETASEDEANLMERVFTGDTEESAAALGELERRVDEINTVLDLTQTRAIAFNGAVGAAAFQNDTTLAIRSYEAVLRLAPDDPNAQTQLGHLNIRLRKWEKAENYFRSVLDGHGITSKIWLSISLANLAKIENYHGNLDAAKDYLERSLAIEKELGRNRAVSANLSNLGVIEKNLGNLDLAEGYYKSSLEISEKEGNKVGIAVALSNLGGIERARDNLDASEDYNKRSITIMKGQGRKSFIVGNLLNLGFIEMDWNNLDAAADYFKQSLAISDEVGREKEVVTSLFFLGMIEFARGNLDAAEDYNRRGLAFDSKSGFKDDMATKLVNLGVIEWRRGNLKGACLQWAKAQQLVGDDWNKIVRDNIAGWIETKCG